MCLYVCVCMYDVCMYFCFICMHVYMGWWGCVCCDTYIDARRQLCKFSCNCLLPPLLGSKAQTQVSRLAREELFIC